MIMPFVSRRQFTTALGVASAAALATTAAASAAPPDRTGGDELLRRMHVPVGRSTADGPVWSPTPTGFAGVPTEEAPSGAVGGQGGRVLVRSEEHTSELQSRFDLVCRLLLEKKKKKERTTT